MGCGVIALAIGLVALSAALTAAVIACGKWLHDANREIGNLRDRLADADSREDQYRSERDLEVTAHAVTRDLLRQEQTLRAIAEAQRNEAMRKSRELLAKHMRDATDDEIRETVRDLFETPLSVVPRPPGDGVRREATPPRSEAGTDALLPFDA